MGCTVSTVALEKVGITLVMCIKPGFHIIVSVVRIVSAPGNDPDDYMETLFDTIQTTLTTGTTRSSG